MGVVFGEILKTILKIFFSYCPFLYFEHCKRDISESISVRGMKSYQLIMYNE